MGHEDSCTNVQNKCPHAKRLPVQREVGGKARQGWMVYLCLAIDGVTVTAGRNSEQRVGP